MLTTLEIEFKKDENIKLNLNSGSLMQGALMELINPDYAEYLHENGLHPYSQYIYKDRTRQCYVWKISTLNETAKTEIIDKIQNIEQIHLKHNDTTLKVDKYNIVKSISYKDLANEYMLKNEASKKFVVKFITPTTFKSQGNYINFPYIHNLYSNLLTKWNTFSKEVSLQDSDTQNHLINYTSMVGYKLRSTKYQMESIKINSFLGEICLLVKGPLTLVSIANLLFAYSEFAGIGAKTATGMGGIRIE